MAATIQKILSENENPFRLSVRAGQKGMRNVISWVYMLEDESIISYFHGAELVVTTGMKQVHSSDWLKKLILQLIDSHAAGLVINTGEFIFSIPDEIIDLCNKYDFPLMTMPWEIQITAMIQDFCIRIINEQHENTIHDRAMRDAIFRRDNEEEYQPILAKYYDLQGKFLVLSIRPVANNDDSDTDLIREYQLINRLRRLRANAGITNVRMGVVCNDENVLVILNNTPQSMIPDVAKVIFDVYQDLLEQQRLFIGAGTEIYGISNIYKSYSRAETAMRMAIYRNTPVIHFEDMGIYKILFSVKDEDILYDYANQTLAPLDIYDAKGHEYVKLLKTYIQCNRSLEQTSQALYIHRNTVNYQVQKMKEMLNSPLKTAEDLFPYQAALAIREMEISKK